MAAVRENWDGRKKSDRLRFGSDRPCSGIETTLRAELVPAANFLLQAVILFSINLLGDHVSY